MKEPKIIYVPKSFFDWIEKHMRPNATVISYESLLPLMEIRWRNQLIIRWGKEPKK